MSHEPRDFERVATRTIHEGRIVTLTDETYRYADGKTADREIVRTTGAVAIVAVDDEHVWLVRQPREAVGDPDSLEVPAGRLDVDGEAPLATAQRELAEEIGLRAADWKPLKVYRSSVGFTDEVVHVFLAEGLSEADGEHDSGEDERIEVVRWPLADLDGALAATHDSKTVLGLLLYERLRRVS
ncbi:MAG TPA: NUDIX hydrolase [Baekduia sp.]|uniref:NUDIX hydrolase n=1 Tax=Baekduia sp. TaxID=2600305 RepID=UPI002D76B388|nr:NUDIX hydrolase [Baekduia sp.]HET6507488.1 NUDIX hydrolase [Baekduia sp.]